MKIVSVITARGGSKGLPNKNLYIIKGKELIYYSIKASIFSNVNETWVSTDSDKIKHVALKYGSKVMDRDKKLAGDIIMPDPTLVDFANKVNFDYLVFIQPTSPLIKHEFINEGIEMIKTGKYDSLFSATEQHWLPRWDKNINPINWDILNRPRRQDRDCNYIENGMFYIASRQIIKQKKLRYGGRIGMVKIPLKNSFQLDSKEDLDLLRKLIP